MRLTKSAHQCLWKWKRVEVEVEDSIKSIKRMRENDLAAPDVNYEELEDDLIEEEAEEFSAQTESKEETKQQL